MKMAWMAAAALMACAAHAGGARDAFERPPEAARPWCYWWWLNGHVDRASITADLEAMARLGFGGVLMSDSMGYWDDEDHIVVPARELQVMSPEWRAFVQHAIRECARLGIKFTMNVATSGGKLNGPWPVGADAPKRLMCRVYPAGAEFEKVGFPFWQEVGTREVFAADASELVAKGWFEAGDGARTQEAHSRNETVARKWIPALDPKADRARRYVVRFGATVIPGHDTDVDVLDPAAIERHFNRFSGAIMDEAGPELVGADRTVAGVYSVSWEGVVPSWSANFLADFEKSAGYPLMPRAEILAGFAPRGVDPEAFLIDYRRARNDMFRENFYGTLARLAHARGVMMYSENGGPWRRDPELLKEASQLKFLSLNDMPQGEFWVREGRGLDVFWGDRESDFIHDRGVVSAAHVYGRRRVSLESFTHMTPHYSISPATLRKAIDIAFADGVNHVVWHTFTLSPDKFGVPGCEYFAGTHVNRSVTWHGEAGAFIAYLRRCEAVMQLGEPVVDIAVRAGRSPYAHWGRYRGATPDGAAIPAGYNYDLVDDDEWAKSTVRDGWRVMASGMKYPAELPALPDLEGPFSFAHRRTADADVYFLQGFAKGRAVFRARRTAVSEFDAVTGEVRRRDDARPTADGRTALELDLTVAGSAIIVFEDDAAPAERTIAAFAPVDAAGPWDVSFAYHRLAHTRHLPAPRKLSGLEDWTRSEDADLRYFAGTATYRTKVEVDDPLHASAVSLGGLPSGVAHVFVNGADCGTVWCAPWRARIPAGVLKRGANELEIRYTNNWMNRLIGDCLLEPPDRVTSSYLQLLKGSRTKPNGKRLNVWSGYCGEDALQPSGLTGPVRIE